jgi:hypothetical protein
MLEKTLGYSVSILGGRMGGFTPIFAKILHRKRRKKINKCSKFSLFDKNPLCFSNPRKDTGYLVDSIRNL